MFCNQTPVAIVTGGSLGLGYATVQELCLRYEGKVLFTSSNDHRAQKAASSFRRRACFPDYFHTDLTDKRSRERFADYVRRKYGGVDVLVNADQMHFVNGSSVPYAKLAAWMLELNFYGTVFMTQLLFPLLRPGARVLNLVGADTFLARLPAPHLREALLRDDLRMGNLYFMMTRYLKALREGDPEAGGWGGDAHLVTQLLVAAVTFIQQRDFARRTPGKGVVVNCMNPGAPDLRKILDLEMEAAGKRVVRLVTEPDQFVVRRGRIVWPDFTPVDWNGTKPD